MSPRRPEPRLYNRVGVLRAERDLSRVDLAEALGINYQTVGYIERGEYNPSLELAFAMADYFGLPIEAIFSRRPFPPMSAQLYGRAGAVERADAVEPPAESADTPAMPASAAR